MDHGGGTTAMRPAHRLRQGGKRVSSIAGEQLPTCAGPLHLYLPRSSSMLDKQRHRTLLFSMTTSNLVQQRQEDANKQGRRDTEQQESTTVGGFAGRGHDGGFTRSPAEMPGGPSGQPH